METEDKLSVFRFKSLGLASDDFEDCFVWVAVFMNLLYVVVTCNVFVSVNSSHDVKSVEII